MIYTVGLHYGHSRRKDPNSVIRDSLNMMVSGTRPLGRPRLRWMDNITADLRNQGLVPTDALDKADWKMRIAKADPACAGPTLG